MIGPDDSADRSSGRPGPRRVAGGGEDAIGTALRSLPADAAGPGFTARVLARLDGGGRARRPAILRPAAGWAALAAAALAGAVGIAVVRSGAPPVDEPERVAEVRPSPSAPARPANPAATEARSAEVPPAELDSEASPPPPVAAAPARSSAPAADARDSLARLRAELDALRREHRRLEIGLSDLPEVGRDGQPMIYLGGDEGLGLVLDLGRESGRGRRAGHEQDSGTSL